MVSKEDTVLTVQCAVCKKILGTKPGLGVEGISHGYCESCFIKTAREMGMSEEKIGQSLERIRSENPKLTGYAGALGTFLTATPTEELIMASMMNPKKGKVPVNLLWDDDGFWSAGFAIQGTSPGIANISQYDIYSWLKNVGIKAGYKISDQEIYYADLNKLLKFLRSNNRREAYNFAIKHFGGSMENPAGHIGSTGEEIKDYFRMKRGNAKLFNILIFDLVAGSPAHTGGSCLNTKTCEQSCYAIPQQKLYPNVMKWRQLNFNLAKNYPEDLRNMINTQLEKERRKKRGKKSNTVRIHSAGDFFNQQYINTWGKIVGDNPDVRFYAYTKVEKMFNFSPLTRHKNFNLISSFINGHLNYGSIEYVKALKKKHGAYICPATFKEGVMCNRDCFYCITKNKPCFVVHGSMKGKRKKESMEEAQQMLSNPKGKRIMTTVPTKKLLQYDPSSPWAAAREFIGGRGKVISVGKHKTENSYVIVWKQLRSDYGLPEMNPHCPGQNPPAYPKDPIDITNSDAHEENPMKKRKYHFGGHMVIKMHKGHTSYRVRDHQGSSPARSLADHVKNASYFINTFGPDTFEFLDQQLDKAYAKTAASHRKNPKYDVHELALYIINTGSIYRKYIIPVLTRAIDLNPEKRKNFLMPKYRQIVHIGKNMYENEIGERLDLTIPEYEKVAQELFKYYVPKEHITTKKGNPAMSYYLGVYKDMPNVGTIVTSATTPTAKRFPYFKQMFGPRNSLKEIAKIAMGMGVKVDNPGAEYHIEGMQAARKEESEAAKKGNWKARAHYTGKWYAHLESMKDSVKRGMNPADIFKIEFKEGATTHFLPLDRNSAVLFTLLLSNYGYDYTVKPSKISEYSGADFYKFSFSIPKGPKGTIVAAGHGAHIIEQFMKKHKIKHTVKSSNPGESRRKKKSTGARALGMKPGKKHSTGKKRQINLKAIAGAIKSPRTPKALKEGLIRKYGRQLGM